MSQVRPETHPASPGNGDCRNEIDDVDPDESLLDKMIGWTAVNERPIAKRDWRRRKPRRAGSRPRKHRIRLSERGPFARGGFTVGSLVGLNDLGRPLVRHPLDPQGRARVAQTVVRLAPEQIGSDVVLALESGELEKPIILGVLLRSEESKSRELPMPRQAEHCSAGPESSDGDRLVLTAEKELVLSCGKARLTLTRAGKVLLRGTYVSSHSSGVQRIRGGSVQIN